MKHHGGSSLVGKAVVLFVGAYVVMTLVMVSAVRMPEIPLLHSIMFVIPLIASGMIVVSWYELGTPWPAASIQRSRQATGGALVSATRRLATRAG
jgi:hypothetical protein